MTYPDSKTLMQSYAATQGLIERHCDGLTHEQSVVQPPFSANCLNWVLGHILNGRERALKVIQAPPVLTEPQYERYATGSEPVTDSTNGLRLEELLELSRLTHQRLDEHLEPASPEFLTEVVDTQFGRQPRSSYLAGLHWHETYHTGQLDLLRALSLSE